MSKTLLVSYTPRHESNTAKLIDTFINSIKNKTEITHLDLVKSPPSLLLEENLNGLLKRNFFDQELTETENEVVKTADALTQQLLDSDRIVLAFPMFNFSMPATVKAWIDLVVQRDKTFVVTEEGEYQGLCHDKKGLILMTTGADYSLEPMIAMEHAGSLAMACLGFMGIESDIISAQGLNQYEDKAEQIVMKTQQELESYLNTNMHWS